MSIHSMRNVQEDPDNLELALEGLRKARKRPTTALAIRLEKADQLRHATNPIEEYEFYEPVGDGKHSLGSSRLGGQNAAFTNNSKALVRNFASALPELEKLKWFGIINRAYWAIVRYGVSQDTLNAIMHEQGYVPRNSKGQTAAEAAREAARIAEEEEIWAAYSPSAKGHRALHRLTTLINEDRLR